jgi:HPt (histidine-containing phosphotransfer) domain-containing protein
VELLAIVIADQRTIFAIIGLLLIWAGWSLGQLYRRTSGLIIILKRARSLVQSAADPRAFTASFEATAQQLAMSGPLSARWSAYRDTLIVPDADAPFGLVRSTLRPDQLFDLRLLHAVGLRPRYHAAMPGMLVGAGLLFTFLGLAIALLAAGDVVAGADPAQRQQGLHQLLNAASFKFFTSLAGLALSISYTLARNSWMRAVEQALDAFNSALDQQMPLATPALLQNEANDALRKQSAALETFGTELAVNIGQTLDRAFDQRLGEHIGPLTTAMQSLANRIGAQNEDAMQQMLQAFIDRLSGGTRDHLAEVTENLAALGTRLEGLQSGLGEASVRMAQAAEEMAQRMGDGAEAALSSITGQMGGLLETLRSVAAQTRDAGAEAAHTLAARIEAAAEGFEVAAAQMTEQLAEAARGTSQAFAHAAVGTSEAITQGANDASKELKAAAGVVRETLEGSGHALARQATALAVTAEALAARINELDRAAREAVAPFAAGAADLRRTAEAAQAATGPLGAVASRLGIAVEQMGGAAQGFAAAQVSAAKLSNDMSAAAQRFEGVDRSLGDTLRALGSGLDEFRRRIQEFVTGTDRNLAQATDHVLAMIKELGETLEDFQQPRRPN